MGFYSGYKNVFDAVKVKLEAVSLVKKVVLGERFTLSKLPLAIINPSPTPIVQGSFKKLSVEVSFDVILVVRSTEPADWFKDVIKPLSACVDALLADRNLGGAVRDLIPTAFSPGEIRFSAQKLYYGGLISFRGVYYFEPT